MAGFECDDHTFTHKCLLLVISLSYTKMFTAQSFLLFTLLKCTNVWTAFFLQTRSRAPDPRQARRTEAHISNQRRGCQRSSWRSVYVPGVTHQERRLFHQAAGDADVVDAEEAAASERDVPRRVQGKHAVRRVVRARALCRRGKVEPPKQQKKPQQQQQQRGTDAQTLPLPPALHADADGFLLFSQRLALLRLIPPGWKYKSSFPNVTVVQLDRCADQNPVLCQSATEEHRVPLGPPRHLFSFLLQPCSRDRGARRGLKPSSPITSEGLMPVAQSQVRRADHVTDQAAETTRWAVPALPLLQSCRGLFGYK